MLVDNKILLFFSGSACGFITCRTIKIYKLQKVGLLPSAFYWCFVMHLCVCALLFCWCVVYTRALATMANASLVLFCFGRRCWRFSGCTECESADVHCRYFADIITTKQAVVCLSNAKNCISGVYVGELFCVFFFCLVLLTKISVWCHTMLLGLHSVQKRRTTILSSLVKQLFIVSLWRTSSRWLCYALQSSFVVRSHSASCREIAAYFSYRSGCEFIHFACLLLYVSQRENNCKYILQKSTHRPVNIIIYNMRAIWERANTIWFIRCSFVSRIILPYICTSVQICIVRCSWTTFPTSSKSRISVWRSAIFHCYK